jgi:hypothetical protein
MALVACKECGAEVAESAPVCPKCGVPSPAGLSCQLKLIRTPAVTGFAHITEAFLDDRSVGRVKMGESITVESSPGRHELVVLAAGPTRVARSCPFEIDYGQTAEFETGFSAWSGLYVKLLSVGRQAASDAAAPVLEVASARDSVAQEPPASVPGPLEQAYATCCEALDVYDEPFSDVDADDLPEKTEFFRLARAFTRARVRDGMAGDQICNLLYGHMPRAAAMDDFRALIENTIEFD